MYNYDEFVSDMGFQKAEAEKPSVGKVSLQLVSNENQHQIVYEDHKPDYDPIREKCSFMNHCEDNAAEISEPEWFAQINIISMCKDSEEIIHKISSVYPGYCENQTQKKIERAKNHGIPITCSYIAEITGSEHCIDCEYIGKVKTPLVFGKKKHCRNDKLIEDINEKHFLCSFGGKTVIGNESINDEGKKNLDFSSATDFKIRYCNQFATTWAGSKTKEVPLGDYWLKHPDRRQYETIVFQPGKETSKNYNLFQGFNYKPKKGIWKKTKKFILEIICNNNKEIYKYVLSLIARIFQDPGGDKPGVCIVMKGKRGVGKSFFVNIIGSQLFHHYIILSQPSHLTGHFNSHLAQSIIVFCDEGFFAGDKGSAGTIKSLITDSHMMLEAKGKDAIMVKNHINLFIASNNNWVVPAGARERRFLVLDVSDKYIQNHKYFAGIQKELENGGYEAMLYDLLNRDISKINLREVPKTSALFDQIVHGMEPHELWWFECLLGKKILETYDALPEYPYYKKNTNNDGDFIEWDENRRYASHALFDSYRGFCKQRNSTYILSNSSFFKYLKSVCPNMKDKDRGKVSRRHTRIDISRPYAYRLPTIKECREHFGDLMGIDLEWNNT